LHGSLSDQEFTLFSKYIADKSGIIIPPEKAYLIETRLTKLMLDVGYASFADFYSFIISNSDPGISDKIINAITVNETMWFRDASLWKVFEEKLLPKMARKLFVGRRVKIRIWCAAASTGQEAYSVAMFIDDYLKKNKISEITLSNFEIFATDVSNRVLDIAKKGRYDRISMSRGMPECYKNDYFSNKESTWEIDPAIKKAVRFENINLKNDFSSLGVFDVILCRYVLIYFSDELKQTIINRMRDSLADDGTLFTGIYVLSDFFKDGFEPKYYDNLTYYEKSPLPATKG
jgi:chemotaxis protein methyltransferase CheR